MYLKKQLEKVEKFGESLNKSKKLVNIGKVGHIGKQLGNNMKTVGTVATNWTHFGNVISSLENSKKTIKFGQKLYKRCKP